MEDLDAKTAAIYATLTDIFRDIFDDDEMTLRPDLTAEAVTGWDSFRQVEILIAVQEAFKIKLTSREIDDLACVGDLAKTIQSHQSR